MKQISSGEPDYAFGQVILALRAATGLTQAGLAKRLGVSRRAVGAWEAGGSYPKAEHLKELIALGMQHHAFPFEREEEEIRALWQASHQKLLLDEPWLSCLLQQGRSLLSPPATSFSREAMTCHEVVKTQSAASGPRVDWGQAMAIPSFYGREQEMAQLTGWVLQEHCQVVSLLGMGGIGKSALAVNVMYQLAEHFDVVIFRSLRDTPSCEELLDDCLQVLAPQPLRATPTSLQRRISLLLQYLRSSHILLVLDNLESLLQERDVQGHMRPGFEGYEQLLRQVAETAHQSCLLLTSREKPAELRPLEGKRSLVRSLRLSGLDTMACQQLFTEKEVVGSQQEQARLVEVYAGNPLALKIVTETITDLFGGDIGQFLTREAVIFGSIADLLTAQFARLSSLERTVLYWLAIVREPTMLDELQAVLVVPLPRVQVLEAVNGLRRRSFIERGQRQGSFTLQSVVLEYMTEQLVTEATSEIQQRKLDLLIEYGLEQASAKEYVRQTQQRLLVAPILAYLQSTYQRRAAVEELVCSLLDQLRQRAASAQGYGPANLISLLRLLCGHLRGLDLSHLSIRGAYLQGIEMQDASLAGTTIRDTAFTEALDATWAVAISSSGKYWAAGSRRGEVRVWREGGQTLHLAWQAHTDNTYTLAFSPDECTLVTGSWDGTVKRWDLESGALFWTGRQTGGIRSVAFSPDGQVLASGGADALVQLWDPQSGTNLQTLEGQNGPVYSLAWSPDGRLLASGCFDGCIQVWEMQKTQPGTLAQTLAGHTNWVTGLAFAPDGTRLASASWDRTVRLWEVASGGCLQTLEKHTDRVLRVAWSPDGRTVASGGFDETIWLWDVATSSYRTVLHEHVADVYDIAFTPDSCRLFSGSEDGTLRVWDVASGQCIRIMQGYAISLYDIAWSPDGTQLASAGSDTQVTIWDVAGGTLLKVLHGHRWIVYGVAWSPDGRLLASGGWDNAIRLWDLTTGVCMHIFRDPDYPDTEFQGVAWSPDGHHLACGSYLCGVQMWNMTALTRRWVDCTHLTNIRRVAWSPDGTRLASCGEDGSVCLWEASDGTQLQTLRGHGGVAASVAWSPDGTRLASGGSCRGGGELFMWNASSGECLQVFPNHIGTVLAVAWSPNGEMLISGDSDGTMRWWDVQREECLMMRQAHQGGVQSIEISPDGRRLASCGDDGAIMIWDLDSGEHLQTLRRDRPYERLNITGIRGLTQAEITTLCTLGAVEDETSI